MSTQTISLFKEILAFNYSKMCCFVIQLGPNTIIELTIAVRKQDEKEITSIVSTQWPRLDDSIGLWLDGILRKDVLL